MGRHIWGLGRCYQCLQNGTKPPAGTRGAGSLPVRSLTIMAQMSSLSSKPFMTGTL